MVRGSREFRSLLAKGLTKGLAFLSLAAMVVVAQPSNNGTLRAPLRQVLEAFSGIQLDQTYIFTNTPSINASWQSLEMLKGRVTVWVDRCPTRRPANVEVYQLGAQPRGILVIGWGKTAGLFATGDERQVEGAMIPPASAEALLKHMGLTPITQSKMGKCP